ncbi:cytochrome c5 family protein [Marinobacter salinexigens]|uniref:Cytochrome c5 family protein n=1 Tax=Marinobacter salinexigens TaxID=2919747 RepID=A0A5B0VCH8_9GAMM|nr:c-type cytochrome [Marinobacter salinexigens]KAA1172360.1 cytochrome c5 family protein [Marinobacter salinexigens]
MKRVLAAVLLGFGLVAGTAMASVEEEIGARIAPVGEMCLEGEECGAAAAPTQAANAGPRSGDEVYNSVCMACHGTGVAGAPVKGDASAWAPRIDKGMETLINHALNGFNAMPAKGGCASCPDEEIQAAVEFMVSESK